MTPSLDVLHPRILFSLTFLDTFSYFCPISSSLKLLSVAGHDSLRVGSGAALATVIGPLMEVPLMLSVVKLGLRTRRYFPSGESNKRN